MSGREGERRTVAPDGRPMAEQPDWRRDFPIDVPQDNYVARRDFTKFLGLTSLAFAVGQLWIAAQSWLRRRQEPPGPRPVAVLAVVVLYTTLGVLTYQGATSPWSPKMTAWSGDPIPERLVRDSTPLRLQGAALFQSKDCRNCHALDGIGGLRGPDLTTVGTRLTRDQCMRPIEALHA